MKKQKTKILFLYLFLIASIPTFPKNGADSLKVFISTASGTEKAKALIMLASSYSQQDTATSFSVLREAFEISKKTGYKRGMAYYFFFRSRVLSNCGKEEASISFLNQCFHYIDTLQPNSEWGSYYINLGGIYSNASKLESSSGAYLKALKIFDKINDTVGVARACQGLGVVQHDAGNVEEAEKYYLKAMKYYEMAGMKREVATMMANLGGVFLNKFMSHQKEDDFKKALDYLNKGLSLSTKTKDYKAMTSSYNNLASLYGFRGELDICLEYNFKSLAVAKAQGMGHAKAHALGSISNVYHLKKRNDLAEKYALEAIAISNEINALDLVGSGYGLLSDIYAAQNKFEKSLSYYKKSQAINDSINNAGKIQAMSELEKKYDTEKKDQEIELLNQTQQMNDAVIARQKIMNYSIGSGFALIFLFSFFLLRAYREKREANNQLQLQKEIIEEKNRSITDSINYAKTIQTAIIPDKDEFLNYFPDSFILYLPKDIVSGDFYWISQVGNKVFFATVDCTGHGVPGGFMSMLSSSLLSEIVNERKITSTAEILNQLREKIMFSLRQTGQTGESKDGMDISLCCLEKDTLKLVYSNAYNSFYIVKNNELIESEINKMPVGYHHIMEPFKESEIQLQKGDVLYLFTDGYADQFGGKKEGGKKFKYSRLKTLLLSVQNKSMPEQKIILEETTLEWRGELEQVDDICVIGIKI